ncbi:MAG: GIY-YIG nuclease family protein [Candidatus Neomarinimicrobiota bacterium]
MAFTYILKCADGSYYTGVTNNIHRRFWEHQQGLVPGYTHRRRPVTLAWCSDDVDIASAIHTEKRIKGWRREKKEALIRDEVERLPELSVAYSKRDRSPVEANAGDSDEPK